MNVVMNEGEEPRRLPSTDLNEKQVHAACDALNLKGVEPTYKAVRAELGDHGSFSTIAKYLKTWAPEARSKVPDLPIELVKESELFLKAVWGVAATSASALFAKEREGYKQEVRDLHQAVIDAEADSDRYRTALASSQSAVAAFEARCAAYEQRVSDAETESARLRGEITGLERVLKELAGHIELERLSEGGSKAGSGSDAHF